MRLKNIIKKDIEYTLMNLGFNINFNLLVQPSKIIKTGHYQINNLIKISNALKIKPDQLAKMIILNIKNKKRYKKITFSHPGFINIFFNYHWLSKKLEEIFYSCRLGVQHILKKNVVIDYSSPNVAKEMHVGHLRSTIIGDVMARVLEFLGHNVIRSNHIGDWGTQFGMLIAYLEHKRSKKKFDYHSLSLKNLENFYCKAKKKYDSDDVFSKKSKEYVVKLQNGDKYCLAVWKKIVSITMIENQKIYKKLNVTLTLKHTMGESLYNKMLPNIVNDLKNKKIAIKKEGTTIVVLDNFKNRLGKSMGVIIQKKDTGFLYSTTDIACLKYRFETLHADRIIYYTDSRQHQYLMQIWEISRKANYVPKNLLLEHHMFGIMLSKEKQPFKTRDGNAIKLSALLEEASKKAMCLIKEKNPYLSKKKLMSLSDTIGISSIKYSDLSKNRNTNYVFNWDTMLNFEGNTALYIQYAYTRITSMLKKSTIPVSKLNTNIILIEESEINLAIKILEFEEIILIIAQKGYPHVMCKYLYDLASFFSIFYENCSVLFSSAIKITKSRLKLSFLTAKTIKKGLNILGIKTIKKM